MPNDIESKGSSRVSFNQNLSPASVASPLRRSRADTMPSQSSAFPYATDIFSNLTNPNTTPTTSSASSSSSSILNDSHSNLSLASSRNRSGSMSLPSAVYNTAAAPSSFGYNPYDPSSPIDENASNTIASTLASLGLDDEEHHTHFEDHTQSNTRARSYTVTGQLGNSMATPSTSRLAFSPFSPHTRSSVLHRPRAISLGMADSFSPFDMTQENPSNTVVPVSQSRLRMQQTPLEVPLRSSRSSSNLVDMNIDHVYSLEDDQVTYIFLYIYIQNKYLTN
jgi:hypothetical protein